MKNRSAISMMILVLLLPLLHCAMTAEEASYIPLPVGVLKDQLNAKILDAVKNGQHFYIGTTKACGTSLQSLCSCEVSCGCTQTDATRCEKASEHHIDKEAKEDGLRLAKVFYAADLIAKNKVCELETELIAEHQKKKSNGGIKLCLNKQAGKANCIKAEKGIVYLRIYDDKNHRHAPEL